MSEGKRPGGLTALAVINFVFGAFSLLGIFGIIFMFNAPMLMDKARDQLERDGASEAQLAQHDKSVEELEQAIEDMGGDTGLWINLVASFVFAGLLIASGIGYLKQKKVLGRKVGNIYGILGVLLQAGMAVLAAFNFGMLIGFLYPVLTLILLNTTFKDDFVN